MNLKLIVLLSLVLVPIANASMGKTFDLDFNAREKYSLWFEKSDRVLFEYGGYSHTIIIDEIKEGVVELDVFLFLEGGLHTPHYATITKKYNLRLDFDKDGSKELQIDLVEIGLDRKRVNFGFKKLESWDPNIKLKPFWGDGDSKEERKNILIYWVLGLVGLVILLSFIFILDFIKRKKGGLYF